MAFTFDATLADARSRMRLAVGDVVSPGLAGDISSDATYDALLSAAGDDEAMAIRQMAAALAAWAAAQPSSLTDNGTGLTWAERVAQWNRIALGQAGNTQTPATARSARLGRITTGNDYTVY